MICSVSTFHHKMSIVIHQLELQQTLIKIMSTLANIAILSSTFSQSLLYAHCVQYTSIELALKIIKRTSKRRFCENNSRNNLHRGTDSHLSDPQLQQSSNIQCESQVIPVSSASHQRPSTSDDVHTSQPNNSQPFVSPEGASQVNPLRKKPVKNKKRTSTENNKTENLNTSIYFISQIELY